MPKNKPVQEIIAENGMTMKQFANNNGFPQSSVSNTIKNWFPNGKRKPGVPRGRTAVIAARIDDLIRSHRSLSGKKTIDM